MNTIRRILVPCDGSTAATKALVAALQMARDRGASVRAIHVVDGMERATGFHYSPALLQELRRTGERVLRDAAAVCQAAGVPHDTHLTGRSGRLLGEAVADEATDWNADLVVVGTQGRHGLGHLMLGSGAEQILRLASVPVLVIRETARTRPRMAGVDASRVSGT